MDRNCQITLKYFNSKGRAEVARYILHYAGKEFTDQRIEKADWPAMKPETPLGCLPVIELTDKSSNKTVTLCQSNAIYRQLAKLVDLAGENFLEGAYADEAAEIIRDVGEFAAKTMFTKDDAEKEKLMAQLKEEIIPKNFGCIEKRIQENGGKNIAGGGNVSLSK